MSNEGMELFSLTDKIWSVVESGKGLIETESINEFKSSIDSYKEHVEEIKKTNRVLRIGIVGEMKAGKSSFLNALLFDGQNFLPKAATPMTAALTILGYSEKPYAKIVFYSKAEWQNICDIAKEFDDAVHEEYIKQTEQYNKLLTASNFNGHGSLALPRPDKAKIAESIAISQDKRNCKELTEMAKKIDINIYDILGTSPVIEGDVMNKIHDYIGSDGKYTVLVKYVEIYVDNEKLRNFEIIDTPGLNDPIGSRSDKTKHFIEKCDVVFFLSYTGQFLTENDISLLKKTLPENAVNNVVVIASKFDSGIMDNIRGKKTFREACATCRSNIEKQCIKYGYNREIHKNLYFTSSIMYQAGICRRDGKPFPEDISQILNNLHKFKDFNDNKDFLFGLAGIDKIRNEVFGDLNKEKDAIISNKIQNSTEAFIEKLVGIMKNINDVVTNNKQAVETSDRSVLEHKLSEIRNCIESVRTEVRGIFATAVSDVEENIDNIFHNIAAEIDNHTTLELGSKQEIITNTRHSGLFGWVMTDITESIEHKTVSIDNVFTNLRQYKDGCLRIISDNFKYLFDRDAVSQNIKNVAKNCFDLSDRSFNKNDILIPVENALRRLTIPKFDNIDEVFINVLELLKQEIRDKSITNYKSDIVQDENISTLLRIQQEYLVKFNKYIKNEIEKKSNTIIDDLNNCSVHFIDDILEKVQKNTAVIEELLKNKEESLEKLETYRKGIEESCQKLNALRNN